MKFSKSLHRQIVETLPEWRDKFLSYKDLKKWLKLLGGTVAGERQSKRQRVGDGSPPAMTTEDAAFVALLEAELDKFNGFFLEKEEDYVIRQKELQDRVVRAAETGVGGGADVGLVKILKKYDKRTGALIRLPFIQSVMQEPFFTTDLLNKLVKDCEAMLEQLVPRSQPSVPNEDGREDSEGDDNPANPSASLANGAGCEALELEDIEVMESMYMKSTVAALRALKEIRSGSSTVSALSLPPLHGGGVHEQRGILSRKT
ncbi:hypothetical protein PR202_gb06536 [Eleusine coracana subsp. coracana]|uniref:SPX domain-containing protein n=1 Tax=Eleusine coracana subsp. coracana TaxID=191504 RepID=A0AAV5E9V4_ELECO|nr:hypothetical protein PR202_gb06536 [Eleusine coracana subsp. coracana]